VVDFGRDDNGGRVEIATAFGLAMTERGRGGGDMKSQRGKNRRLYPAFCVFYGFAVFFLILPGFANH